MYWPGVVNEMLDDGAEELGWQDQISIERAKRADRFGNLNEGLLRGSLLLIIVAPAAVMEEHSGAKCQNEFELDEVRGLLETKTRYCGE